MVRWVYRRRRVIFFILCASSFWIAYLYLSLPAPKENRTSINFRAPKLNVAEDFRLKISQVTTRVVTPRRPHVIDNRHLVLEPPLSNFENTNSTNYVEKSKHVNKTSSEKTVGHWMDIGHLKNKTLEIGAKFKNKTFEVAESVRNKTMQHLAVFGVGNKGNPVRFIFEPHRWNLSLSFEDIGNIMKDTEFLNKLHPLDLSAPVLASSKNRTTNYTYNMPYHVGFCDCYEHHCLCCARIANKRLHLNTTACSNFTFVSKSQELTLEVLLDAKPIYKNIISADSPPLVCLGTYPKVVDICFHFFNMTFKVNVHHEHKTQLLGCTDFSLNLYNKTIGSFPVDCFQIPGDPNHKHKEAIQFVNYPNWMP